MAKTTPAEFVRQVRQETSRVTWPTRKETSVSAFMVLIMAVVAALFFILVDWLASWAVRLLLGFGG